MKATDMMILAAAAVAAWVIVRSGGAKVGAGGTAAAKPAGWVSEIFDIGGARYGNGWRYYDNGVAIDPAGAYYSGGVLVWSPGM